MATFDDAIKMARNLTPSQIAQLAVEQNAKVMETAPRPLTVVRHVDGIEGALETSVKPSGVIVYDYGRIDLVASFALDTLRQLSPVDSGDYIRSHVIMLNGTVIDNPDNPSSRSLSSWKPGDRITISNLLPYTRKIEIGRKGYRAHGHVYEKAAHIVSGRYGNMARVIFTYDRAPRGGGDAGVYAWAWKRTSDHSRKYQEWLTRQPTLVIMENS